MKDQNDDEIFYSLNIADIQTVAKEEIGRRLTREEIEKIKDPIAERIKWYDAISDAIYEGIDINRLTK
jgi:hypothetical protein